MTTYPETLLDEICDPLEGIVNLVYLLEADAGDRDKVLACSRLLARELARVVLAANRHLCSGSYTSQQRDL